MSLQNVSQVLQRSEDLFLTENILVINPPADTWLRDIASDNHHTTIWTTNYANYEYFMQLRLTHSSIHFSHTLADFTQDTLSQVKRVILHFPKSKQEFAYLCANILAFLAVDTEVYLVGDNKGGIKSCAKHLPSELSNLTKIDSAKHCVVFRCVVSNNNVFDLASWFETFSVDIAGHSLTVYSLPGVFNHGKLDAGTKIFLDNLPTLKGRVLDFGCGAGVIAAIAAKQENVVEVQACDVSALAIAASKKTFAANQLDINVFASNGLGEVKGQFHHIVSNPPFHTGLKIDYGIAERFIANSAKHLKIKGILSIVANSFLPYPELIEKYVGANNTLLKHKGFSIHQATLKLGLQQK